jgi:uncharacterized membrane protein
MDGKPPQRQSAQRWSTSLWIWPAASGAVALVLALLSTRIRPEPEDPLAVLWFGDHSSASSMLQAMATSVMAATALTFSITVVALQLASQQFSPRLLREFAHDPVTKAVLGVLAASFLFSTTALYGVREDEPLPTVSVLVGFLLGVASLFALLGFVSHMVRVVRIDTIMLVVHDETVEAIDRFYPPYGDTGFRSPDELALDDALGRPITARRSGFVQRIDPDSLVEAARSADAVVRIEVRPGDMVTLGTPIGTVWGGSEELDDAVRAAVVLNNERTIDQDAGFGFRQLEDIAVKAVSPSVNDPVTAATAIGHMGDLLVRLTGRHLGPTLHEDENGTGRAIVPDRDMRYYLDLACGQVARFGGSEPTLVTALLRMLRDVATACRDDGQRAEVARAADLVAGELSPEWSPTDTATVRLHHDQVTAALEGRTVDAFADRAGETRSM